MSLIAINSKRMYFACFENWKLHFNYDIGSMHDACSVIFLQVVSFVSYLSMYFLKIIKIQIFTFKRASLSFFLQTLGDECARHIKSGGSQCSLPSWQSGVCSRKKVLIGKKLSKEKMHFWGKTFDGAF